MWPVVEYGSGSQYSSGDWMGRFGLTPVLTVLNSTPNSSKAGTGTTAPNRNETLRLMKGEPTRTLGMTITIWLFTLPRGRSRFSAFTT